MSDGSVPNRLRWNWRRVLAWTGAVLLNLLVPAPLAERTEGGVQRHSHGLDVTAVCTV